MNQPKLTYSKDFVKEFSQLSTKKQVVFIFISMNHHFLIIHLSQNDYIARFQSFGTNVTKISFGPK